jgi:hypothetical protein
MKFVPERYAEKQFVYTLIAVLFYFGWAMAPNPGSLGYIGYTIISIPIIWIILPVTLIMNICQLYKNVRLKANREIFLLTAGSLFIGFSYYIIFNHLDG